MKLCGVGAEAWRGTEVLIFDGNKRVNSIPSHQTAFRKDVWKEVCV